MQRDGQFTADRRYPARRLVVARLTKTQGRAVSELQEHTQALALIDDINDRARQAIMRGIGDAVRDPQLLALGREHQRLAVPDRARALQDSKGPRGARGG